MLREIRKNKNTVQAKTDLLWKSSENGRGTSSEETLTLPRKENDSLTVRDLENTDL